MKKFKDFLIEKEGEDNSNWKKQYIKLEEGFVPPSKMNPIIEGFSKSNSIEIMDDTSKQIKMPKKTLLLCRSTVRDFLRNKTPKRFELTTDATPEQICLILHNAGFKSNEKFNLSDNKVEISFEPNIADENDSKLWYIKNKSENKNEVTVCAIVDKEQFEIDTLTEEYQEEGKIHLRYTNDIKKDVQRVKFTVDAMYIELSKVDGENSKLFDPTERGFYDISQKELHLL